MFSLAPIGWGRGLARGAGEPSIPASVTDVLRPKLLVCLLITACATRILAGRAALARVRWLAIRAGQSAVPSAMNDVLRPELLVWLLSIACATRILDHAALARGGWLAIPARQSAVLAATNDVHTPEANRWTFVAWHRRRNEDCGGCCN